jgi:hypothetical protein
VLCDWLASKKEKKEKKEKKADENKTGTGFFFVLPLLSLVSLYLSLRIFFFLSIPFFFFSELDPLVLL